MYSSGIIGDRIISTINIPKIMPRTINGIFFITHTLLFDVGTADIFVGLSILYNCLIVNRCDVILRFFDLNLENRCKMTQKKRGTLNPRLIGRVEILASLFF